MPTDTFPDDNPSRDTGSTIGQQVVDAARDARASVADMARAASATAETSRVAAADRLEGAASTVRQRAEDVPGGPRVQKFAHAAADRLSSTADYLRSSDATRMRVRRRDHGQEQPRSGAAGGGGVRVPARPRPDPRLNGRSLVVTANRPVSEVLQDILHNLQDLIRSELRLAKAEVSQDARQAAASAAWMGAGAVCGMSAWLFLLWTVAFAAAEILPMWAATLIVAVAMSLAAVVLLRVGRRQMRRVHPMPERTAASLKENLQWIRPSTK